MILPAILDPFVEGAPAAVMTRLALDWILDGTPWTSILQEVAEGQFEREFTLQPLRPGHARRGLRVPSHAARRFPAARTRAGRLDLRLLPEARPDGTGASPRRSSATRPLGAATDRAGGGLMPEPIPGYAARILDGNVLAGTEHRIEPLRTTWSAGLPGMSLAVYEPASGLIPT